MKLLMMIAIDMIQSIQIMFHISMLIFVECIDLVKRLIMKMNIVDAISLRILESGVEL